MSSGLLDKLTLVILPISSTLKLLFLSNFSIELSPVDTSAASLAALYESPNDDIRNLHFYDIVMK